MVRYEVLRINFETYGMSLAPATFMLPVRKTLPSGFCIAVEGSRAGMYGQPMQPISVQIGDGQPLFEGVPAAVSRNGRINFTHEFVPLTGVQAVGAEMRITPICCSADTNDLAIAVILQYDE